MAGKHQRLFVLDTETNDALNNLIDLFVKEGLIQVFHTTKKGDQSRLLTAMIAAVDITAVESELKKGGA
jgi:hypothetical protein